MAVFLNLKGQFCQFLSQMQRSHPKLINSSSPTVTFTLAHFCMPTAKALGRSTHGTVVTLEDDSGGVAALPALVPVAVRDCDGAIHSSLGVGLDVAQVHALAVNNAAGAQSAPYSGEQVL